MLFKFESFCLKNLKKSLCNIFIPASLPIKLYHCCTWLLYNVKIILKTKFILSLGPNPHIHRNFFLLHRLFPQSFQVISFSSSPNFWLIQFERSSMAVWAINSETVEPARNFGMFFLRWGGKTCWYLYGYEIYEMKILICVNVFEREKVNFLQFSEKYEVLDTFLSSEISCLCLKLFFQTYWSKVRQLQWLIVWMKHTFINTLQKKYNKLKQNNKNKIIKCSKIRDLSLRDFCFY